MQRKHKNTKNNKPTFGYFNFGSNNKEVKFAELKKGNKHYYAIGRNKDSGKEFVLDYDGKFRSEAEAYFEMEFNVLNADLVFVGVYN